MKLEAKRNRRPSETRRAAVEDAAREETTRLNVLIPEGLHRDLRLQAVAEGKGTTITSIVVRATRAYLAEHGDKELLG